MRGLGDLHSHLVAWLKILLPLAALGILSTLFLLSRSIDPEDAIPYAEVDVTELARESRLSSPEFSGVTRDGAAITITAASAQPDLQDPNRASAAGLHAVLETETDLRAEFSAGIGTVDTTAGQARLRGGVRLTTSAGYSLTTDAITTALRDTHIEATSAVVAEAPYGSVTAGGMVLSAAPVADTGGERQYFLVFNKGVKLLYLPPNRGSP